MEALKAAALAAGDANGDGEVIVMHEDPFMLNYLGLRALMTPHDDLNTTLAVAARYRVDYIVLPTGRPALVPIATGARTDPRLTYARDVQNSRLKLYRVNVPPTE
jgi:hypothetical protein